MPNIDDNWMKKFILFSSSIRIFGTEKQAYFTNFISLFVKAYIEPEWVVGHTYVSLNSFCDVEEWKWISLKFHVLSSKFLPILLSVLYATIYCFSDGDNCMYE